MDNIERDNILELYALSYKEDHYPPTAGKLMGLLYISEQKYFSFDEFISNLQVTKSAVSKALKFLLNTGEINFIYDANNKRRRLFYLDYKGVIDKFHRIVNAYTIHVQLLEGTLKLRDDDTSELNTFIKKEIALLNETVQFFDAKLKTHF